jgi:hypothetical protein
MGETGEPDKPRENRRTSREKAQKAQGSGAAIKGEIDKIMEDKIMGRRGSGGGEF